MRFKGLDLNLLVALDALMTHRNLTAAAHSINLSQPAMSAAVARLRDYFSDSLFVMRGREFVPTARAMELAGPVREALSHVQLSIISRDVFLPSKSKRRFRICLSDFMTLVYFKKVMKRVACEAPSVSFELFFPDDEPGELLRRGDVDFLILPELLLSDTHPKARLFEEKLVCVGCPTNKQLSRRLALEKYISMGHVTVRFGRSRRPSIEEFFLLELGFKRREEIVVPTFDLIPPMLSRTDRIATLPLRLAQYFGEVVPLRIVDVPLPLSSFTEAIQWPALHTGDPASIWMRQVLLEEAKSLASVDAKKSD
ncbi:MULTISPECIES: LysR family transcriptional regulator [Cupriavidus]|uniref:NodD transcriptional regulator lysR family n=3 Tax=Cupriavidus TaxID=106589 RepID=A0A375HXV3_9BURK|nr:MULTISPECIES: LysR family transcriptional regulator [Cupriavidus]MCO4865831.1 LysR family transcriptional regulator [Cupriavidus sp. WGlv3]MCO4893512.1 LysR family transcriptional regulator [Cupriavidus sp. WGtm5]CAP64019.1 NodD transcriptional regulator; lysR family [Cupriavidus taiwanensis LMG 19424]SOY74914.1 NodD transcriptional regulator; lysR family [Cupriavidus taiwanensis]SOY74925.1 NodD transcriptional regulator; lysR family [Cupriavidus taiwanensis]